MLNYKTSLENRGYVSPVDPFSVPMRNVINEQPEGDIVLPNLKISKKLRSTYKLIINSYIIQYCHYVQCSRIFLDKLCLEMLFKVITYTLVTQIIAKKTPKKPKIQHKYKRKPVKNYFEVCFVNALRKRM